MKEVRKYARFYLQSRKEWAGDKQLDRPIIMWFNYNGKSLNTTTGIKTSEQNWDSKKQRLKPAVKRAAEVNRYLDRLEQKLNDIYFSSLADGIACKRKAINLNSYFLMQIRRGVFEQLFKLPSHS